MSISCIQNQLLEITVVECSKLKDTEWISRQDPYVCLEYGSTKFRTRTCTDGGKTPVFQEKFMFTLIQGLREINVAVWNSNTLSSDDFIGSGKIQLQDVLSRGYDDKSWPIHSKSGRYAGEVKLILHVAQPNAPAVGYGSQAPHAAPCHPQVSPYSVPPPASTSPYTNSAFPPSYPPQSAAYPTSYPPQSAAYQQPSYPPQSAAYQQPSYPPQSAAYTTYPSCPPPHQPYSSAPPYPPPPGRSLYPPPEGYPTTTYPPPPPPHASPYGAPGAYGLYPTPPY